MKNIYLIGFMGAGKTTVGKILATKINKEFVEMDQVIVCRQGSPVKDIFKNFGEAFFRQLEKKLLQELSKKTDLVIGCGRGLVCDEENLALIKATGNVVNLSASKEVIHERLKLVRVRPLLKVDDPNKAIDELMEKRKPFYDQAHVTIATDTLTPEAVADQVIKALQV